MTDTIKIDNVLKRLRLKSFFESLFVIFIACLISCDQARNVRQDSVIIEEITVRDIHGLVRRGELTFAALTQAYIDRINRYDQTSRLNSIVIINPSALQDAKAQDDEFKKTGTLKPLQGIPVIVKDNYQTKQLQTTAGSLALQGFEPATDAFQVARLREAGAIILAKSNMAEWAFSPYLTESSIAGVTRNPYDLTRVPAGSSGGTAASIAANFAMIGLGTDTGNSIRGPSSHNALVGIRSSMGLTSRSGIIPLLIHNDIGGPMARTLEDAVRVLDVIAGVDLNDPVTLKCAAQRPANYMDFLDNKGLQGVRVGVFRDYIDAPTAEPAIKALAEQAIDDIRSAGAVVVDPIEIPNYKSMTQALWCDRFAFQYDLDTYLVGLGESAPYPSLQSIVATGKYSPYIKASLLEALETVYPISENPPCENVFKRKENIIFRNAVKAAVEKAEVDFLIYPTWSNLPRKVGDLESTPGDNSQYLSPHTGFPAITVPMGYVEGKLPAGLTFIGRMCGEGPLIAAAFAYEQLTRHRKPPELPGVPKAAVTIN